MIHLSRWKVILLALSLAFGILFAYPSLLTPAQREALPGFLPKNTLNLGLDLQGGSYLLLEVDVTEMQAKRVANMVEEVREIGRASSRPRFRPNRPVWLRRFRAKPMWTGPCPCSGTRSTSRD